MASLSLPALVGRPGLAIDLDRELIARHGLAEFARRAWHVLEPTTPLRWGWSLDAICEHLEAISRGEVKRLLINVPPGSMKSLLAGVFWPAWEWGPQNRPELRIGGASYSEAYATRDSRRMRNLVMSPWYQARWGDRVRIVRSAERSFDNDRTGSREGIPFIRLTGGRFNRVIIDDPHSTEGSESPADRMRAVRVLRESVPTRLVDPVNDAILVIMQRLHANDCSGEILSHPEWGYDHLMLPMEFEPERRCVTSIGFRDPRTEEGELLFPERFPRQVVDRDKEVLGSYAVAGQFQQRPAPRGGGLIQEAWLANRFIERGRNPIRLVQSWDCASKPQEHNDPSACLTVAEFPDRFELWDVFVKRLEFPDLLRKAKELYAADWGGVQPSTVLIEDKDAGQQLIQTLRRDRETKLPVIAINPGSLDKETRLQAETPTIEAGRLWLPRTGAWVGAYVEELTQFPASAHKDQVDATSQVLRWFRLNRRAVLGAPFAGVAKDESGRGV